MDLLGVWAHEEREEKENHVRRTTRDNLSETYSISRLWTQRLVTDVDAPIPRRNALEGIGEMAGLLDTPI